MLSSDPVIARNLEHLATMRAAETDEDFERGLALAAASERAAQAMLERVMAEAVTPPDVLQAIERRARAPVARTAPARAAPVAPARRQMSDEELSAMTQAFWENEAQSGMSRPVSGSTADGTMRPVLYGGASPSLARLLRSRGQEPLTPVPGSYYLPPSAANASLAAPEPPETDGYTGLASPSLRRMLASRGQRPADDLR